MRIGILAHMQIANRAANVKRLVLRVGLLGQRWQRHHGSE
jgi:hypothetical protein